MSTGDENSPGNYGILDQAMALRWVYDNIEFFNGDRNLITLFGPGAGAASAGLLMVAPRTRGLVSRVIAQVNIFLVLFLNIGIKNICWLTEWLRTCRLGADWGRLPRAKYESGLCQAFGLQHWVVVENRQLPQTGQKFLRARKCRFPGKLYKKSFIRGALPAFLLQPEVGTIPWGPVLDKNFKVPEDHWYDGWRERDWHMFQDMPEKSLRMGDFNKGLSYLGGITHDEAAYFICKPFTFTKEDGAHYCMF